MTFTKGFNAPPSGTGGYPPPIQQAGDPGAVGAGRYWWNTTSGVLAIRNETNTGWNLVQGAGAVIVPASTVTGPDAYGDPAAVGVGNAYARDDHDHGLPAAPPVPSPASTVTGPDAFGDPAAVGVGTAYALDDHDHGLPSFPATPGLSDILGASDDGGAHAITNILDPVNPQDAATLAWVQAQIAGSSSAPTPALMDVFPGAALSGLWTVVGYTPSVAANVATFAPSGGARDVAFVPTAAFNNCRFVARMTFGGSGDWDGLYVGTVAGTGILATNFHGNLYVWHLTAFGTPATPSGAGSVPGGGSIWVEIEKQATVYRARVGTGATFDGITWDAWLTTTNTFSESDPMAVGVIDVGSPTAITTLLSDLLIIPLP